MVEIMNCWDKMKLSFDKEEIHMAKEVKSLTKKELIEELAAKQEITKKEAGEVVSFVFESIANTLKHGGTVDINGFGKFSVKKRAARTGINPRTKEAIKIKATKVPGFKASKTLKDIVK